MWNMYELGSKHFNVKCVEAFKYIHMYMCAYIYATDFIEFICVFLYTIQEWILKRIVL